MRVTSLCFAACLCVLAGISCGCARKPVAFEPSPCPPMSEAQIEQMENLEGTDLEVWFSRMLDYCEGMEVEL